MGRDEIEIHILSNRFQPQWLGTLIEGTLGREKHLFHQPATTSREHEVCIRQFLNMCPENLFHIFFRITCNLLEFVNDNQAALVNRL